MKRYFFAVVALLLALTTVAQDVNRTDKKGRRQGVWMDFYPNGNKRYEGQFKNDKCKGTFTYYDESGKLKATNEFDNSGEKALNKTYAPNGRLIATGYYVNQKKEGEWKYFDKDSGQLLLSEDNKNAVCRRSTRRPMQEIFRHGSAVDGLPLPQWAVGWALQDLLSEPGLERGRTIH